MLTKLSFTHLFLKWLFIESLILCTYHSVNFDEIYSNLKLKLCLTVTLFIHPQSKSQNLVKLKDYSQLNFLYSQFASRLSFVWLP